MQPQPHPHPLGIVQSPISWRHVSKRHALARKQESGFLNERLNRLDLGLGFEVSESRSGL